MTMIHGAFGTVYSVIHSLRKIKELLQCYVRKEVLTNSCAKGDSLVRFGCNLLTSKFNKL